MRCVPPPVSRRTAAPGRLLRATCSLLAGLVVAPTAGAHGFGQRYDLPLPVGLWAFAAAAAVLASFVLMARFVGPREVRAQRRGWLLRGDAPGLAAGLAIGRTLGAIAFVATVVAGLLGSQHAYKNLAPTMVWVIWWVGFGFACALAGNLWELTNPLRALFDAGAALGARLRLPAPRRLTYPVRLGAWPAVAALLAFAWLELVWQSADWPAALAVVMLAYAAITWTGMAMFGADTWLRYAEAFTLAFGFFARFSMVEVRVSATGTPRVCPLRGCSQTANECIDGFACWRSAPQPERGLALRPYAHGLLDGQRVTFSAMAFVLVLLSTVTFDGFLETPLWASLAAAVGDTAWLPALKTLLLVVFPTLLGLALWLTGSLMARAGGVAESGLELARRFVLSLVPIAIAYHLAHYLSMLLVSGQFIIPLASDPLGRGWDLLGTAGYRVDIGIIGARAVWYWSTGAVVTGHVLSVYLSHRIALEVFGERGLAVRSQIPMTILMVGYTGTSIWILAQPIVG